MDLLTTANRLSSFPSINPCIVRAYHHGAHPLVRSHGRSVINMAPVTDADRWNVYWRCMAVRSLAVIPASPALGKHCSLSQAHPVALLLTNGPNVEVAKYPVLG